MSVDTREAEVTSATVEVDTLQVSGKQLTLRTFRQIPQEPILRGDTHELKRPIWGWVNYFWKDVEGDIHALWQKGEELRRDPLPYLDSATVIVNNERKGEITRPSSSRMPFYDLEVAAKKLEKKIETLTPDDNYWYLHHSNPSAILRKVYDTEEFVRFAGLVKMWNDKVSQVESEGQLFIAT